MAIQWSYGRIINFIIMYSQCQKIKVLCNRRDQGSPLQPYDPLSLFLVSGSITCQESHFGRGNHLALILILIFEHIWMDQQNFGKGQVEKVYIYQVLEKQYNNFLDQDSMAYRICNQNNYDPFEVLDHNMAVALKKIVFVVFLERPVSDMFQLHSQIDSADHYYGYIFPSLDDYFAINYSPLILAPPVIFPQLVGLFSSYQNVQPLFQEYLKLSFYQLIRLFQQKAYPIHAPHIYDKFYDQVYQYISYVFVHFPFSI